MQTTESKNQLPANLPFDANNTKYPEDKFSPLAFRRLPASYNIHGTKEQFQKMEQLGNKLKRKHGNWSTEKLMRKVFEAFPSVMISLKTDENNNSETEETEGDAVPGVM